MKLANSPYDHNTSLGQSQMPPRVPTSGLQIRQHVPLNFQSRSSNNTPARHLYDKRNSTAIEPKGNLQMSAFIVRKNQQKPSPSKWSKSRLEELIQLPKHRPPRDRNEILPNNLRNNSPMTMEDKNYLQSDIELRTSLRNDFEYSKHGLSTIHNTHQSTMKSKESFKKEDGQGSVTSQFQQTIPNPPSFYDEDMEKWKKKFEKHIQDRVTFKKLFYKTLELTPITKNTNVADQTIRFQDQQQNAIQQKEGNGATTNIYKRVMQRRKSRQSTCAPSNLDFDYAGDSGQFYHILKNRSSNNGSPTVSQLNFEMKLRSYKNDTEFTADTPWQYPQKKVFIPKEIFKDHKEKMNQTLGDYKLKYNDNFPEKNQYHTRLLVDKHIGMMQTSFWEFNLRSERKKKALNEKLQKITKQTKIRKL